MSSDSAGMHDYVRETAAGQCTIVAALVIALHEAGVLHKDNYRDVLNRLWIGMPETEAVGEAGAAIERVLDLLHASNNAPHASRHVPPVPPASAIVKPPITRGSTQRPTLSDANRAGLESV